MIKQNVSITFYFIFIDHSKMEFYNIMGILVKLLTFFFVSWDKYTHTHKKSILWKKNDSFYWHFFNSTIKFSDIKQISRFFLSRCRAVLFDEKKGFQTCSCTVAYACYLCEVRCVLQSAQHHDNTVNSW